MQGQVPWGGLSKRRRDRHHAHSDSASALLQQEALFNGLRQDPRGSGPCQAAGTRDRDLLEVPGATQPGGKRSFLLCEQKGVPQ